MILKLQNDYFRSSSVVKTRQNTGYNPGKTYSSPPPSISTKSLIPKRREMREDPYKVAIRESQKISMEKGLERNDLSYQIKMLEEYQNQGSMDYQNQEITSNTEPGFTINASFSD